MLQSGQFKSIAVITMLAASASSVAVQAASLSLVQGPVQLSRAGGPFQVVTGPTQVQPGDVVRADAGSNAQVIYANGFVAAVTDGASLTVASDPAAVLTGKALNGAHGSGSGHFAGHSVNTAVLVAGGLAVAGGALLLAKKLSDDTKNKASSP